MRAAEIIGNKEDGDGEEDGEEFEYTPVIGADGATATTGGEASLEGGGKDDGDEKKRAAVAASAPTSSLPFANDGSFLEQMKKELAA